MALDDVQQLLAYLKDAPEITELSVTGSGGTVTLKRPGRAPAPLPAQAAVSETAAPLAEETRLITATMVGLFHESAPPLAAGDALMTGQTVGAIESMRLMNELIAEHNGVVAQVLIAEGQPVEYGQPLFRIQSADAAAPDAARE